MMNAARKSLLDNFTSMQEEFISSNNRGIREVKGLFENNLDDLLLRLKYFNEEYVVIDVRDLEKVILELKGSLINVWNEHVSKYTNNYNNEKDLLKQKLCVFFIEKLSKGSNCKMKMSCCIKKSLNKICDFDFVSLEEKIDNIIYDFKIDFENKYLNDEYSKDDFNKIVNTCKHTLVDKIRDDMIRSIGEVQEIVSRYASKGYDIINAYSRLKR